MQWPAQDSNINNSLKIKGMAWPHR